jgi:hypothetical protein
MQESTVSSTQQFLTDIERLRCSRCQTRMMLERVTSGPTGVDGCLKARKDGAAAR